MFANTTTTRYIYEEFLTTQGVDVKVYTVGGDYAHAEARKAPTLDGRVQRHADTGKEVRATYLTSAFSFFYLLTAPPLLASH